MPPLSAALRRNIPFVLFVAGILAGARDPQADQASAPGGLSAGRRVRVAAPPHVDDDAFRLAVVMRLGWSRRRQAEFERQARQSRRELVTGESHYVDGQR